MSMTVLELLSIIFKNWHVTYDTQSDIFIKNVKSSELLKYQ